MATGAPLGYRVSLANPDRHRFAVELRIARPAAQQVVSLPAWIPGSYLIREFARNLDHLSAHQERAACTVRQLDKCSWQIGCTANRMLTLRYQVYALDPSVRAAWLDAARGFFNGTSLLLRVHGQEQRPHALTVLKSGVAPGWQLATAMTPIRIDRSGFGQYLAADYDELVDHPVEIGPFWSTRFEAGQVAHRLVVAGAPPSFDGERLARDVRTICTEQIRFWHGARRTGLREYLFLLHATQDGYGGLEHRASSALACSRDDLPRSGPPSGDKPRHEAYATLLGVFSHEYFHSWNVKRLRPAEFTRYDYARENYTELLWLFEGFTSYYDDLLLHRAGLIDEETYFKLLARSINQTAQAPGRLVQSVAQASFDAWTRFYRPDANTPNSTISYYGKGSLVALCLDLTLRKEGRTSLDHVMRALWQRCAGGPLRESDLAAVLAELGGRSYHAELAAWVHGTRELPLAPLLASQGVDLASEPAPLAQALGLRMEDAQPTTVRIVLDGGPAADAGIAPGDEWLGLEVPAPTGTQGQSATSWRIRKLEDLRTCAGAASRVHAIVSRDARILRLPIVLPQGARSWKLVRRNPAARAA